MERYAPHQKDLAARDFVSRCMVQEMREGRGCGPNKDHMHIHFSHLDPAILKERLPEAFEQGRTFANVDILKDPIPVVPTVHTHHGEVLTQKNGNPIRRETDGHNKGADHNANHFAGPAIGEPPHQGSLAFDARRRSRSFFRTISRFFARYLRLASRDVRPFGRGPHALIGLPLFRVFVRHSASTTALVFQSTRGPPLRGVASSVRGWQAKWVMLGLRRRPPSRISATSPRPMLPRRGVITSVGFGVLEL
jgi:hypothetical protein